MAQQYRKYREEAIFSMSPAELLLLLYDEITANIRKAQFALEDREYDIFENQIDRTVRIIRYLIKTLDTREPLSRDLRRLYDFMIYDFGRIKAGRERYKDELPRLNVIVKNLRDGFDGAAKKLGGRDPHTGEEKRILG